MGRKLTQYPLHWRQSPYRQPLILQGIRQEGKTYTLLECDKARYSRSPAALSFTRQVLPW